MVGLISSEAAGFMSAVLVAGGRAGKGRGGLGGAGVCVCGSFVGVSQVFFLFYYLLCERPFWGNLVTVS